MRPNRRPMHAANKPTERTHPPHTPLINRPPFHSFVICKHRVFLPVLVSIQIRFHSDYIYSWLFIPFQFIRCLQAAAGSPQTAAASHRCIFPNPKTRKLCLCD